MLTSRARPAMRPGISLRLGTDMRIGIDLGGTKTEAIALDDQGRELGRHRVPTPRSEEHTSEIPSLMRMSYAVFCLKQTKQRKNREFHHQNYRLAHVRMPAQLMDARSRL